MIRKIYTLLILGICLGFMACSDDNEELNSAASEPVIKFPMEQLDVDLNLVDNLPVVAVIKSELGLKSVNMQIKTNTETIDYKTVTEFFNEKSYSLSEELAYDATYEAFIVNAVDKLNRTVTATLPISVTDVVERPVIVFDPAEIIYDEMAENPVMPRTTFKVTSEAGLKKVEMFLVSADGQKPSGTATLSGENEYEFDEMIQYKEGDKGFKVKAEDAYGYTTIATLPVTYKTVPVPVLELKNTEPINADSGVDTEIPMHVTSVRGVKEIVIYRIEDGQDVEALRLKQNGEKELDIAPEIKLTNNTSAVKVVVSDGREGKEVSATVKAYVDMVVATVQIASQAIANSGTDKYPGALGLLSLQDMKTYSIDYAIASAENASNVDFKFYCYGGAAEPRLYGMTNTEKDKEFQAGSTGKLTDIKVKNATAFAILDAGNFNYDDATYKYIKDNILASTVSSTKLTGFDAGSIIAFRTGNTSVSGGGRVGIMKVISISAPKEIDSSNATKRVMTLEIKFPKKK